MKKPNSIIPRNKIAFILLAIVLFGIFLRLYKLDAKSLWMDEVATVILCEGPLSQINDRITFHQNSPPFHYIAVNVFIRLFGENEFAVRLPSVLTGFLSIILIYLLGKELFGKKEGIISALLLSFSSVHVHFSQEARTYSFFIFFMTGSFYFLIKALKDNKLWNWLLFIIFTSLSTHTHYFTAFYVVSEAIFVIFVLIGKRKQEKLKERIKKFLFFLVALFIVGFLFIPSFYLMQKQPHDPLSYLKILSLYKVFFSRLKELFTLYSLGNFLYFNLFFAFLSIIYGLFKKKVLPFLLSVYSFIPLVIGIVFLENYELFNIRYFVPILPIYFLLIANGMVKLADHTERMSEKIFVIPRINLSAVLILLLVFSVAAFRPLQRYYSGEKQDYKGGAEHIKKNMNPQDIIIIGAADGGCYDYYFEKQNTSHNIKNVRSLSDLSMVFHQYEGSDIWYTYSFETSRNITPYLFQWIIGHFTPSETFPSFYGDGMSIKIYHLPGDYVKNNKSLINKEINMLEEKAKEQPSNAMVMNMLAHDYFLLKDYEGTIRWYKEIVKINPENEKIKKELIELQSLSAISTKDSRYLISRWINKNIPAYSKIAIAEELMMPQLLLDFESNRFELLEKPQDEILPLSHLGYDYVILTSIKYPDRGKTEFYKDLFADTELIKRQEGKIINHEEINRIQNPQIFIYKLKEGKEYNKIKLEGEWRQYPNTSLENIFYFSADLLKFPIPAGYKLEILEDGKKLKRINHIWEKPMKGVYTTEGTRGYLYITPIDGSNPNANKKKYMLRVAKKKKQ